MSKQRQIGMQSLKAMCAEFSDEGFVFVDVKVVNGYMDSVTRIWTFVSDTTVRTVSVDDYSIEWKSGPKFTICDVEKVSFDKAFSWKFHYEKRWTALQSNSDCN